ncbi:insulinase family protein [Dysgonomonas sp. 216]|nr:insulinase family protein [Dysgonomonas sp. 216]
MSDYQSYTLKNGLRIIHKPLLTNVSYCGFFINTGTRDELPSEHGMAHFVEHMLFKGTKKRRSYHIINRMEAVGGELNAYTNKEETAIYSVFLEPHFERAFELLTDLTFNSEFPESEIEKEIDVILDEINSYEDSPSELIFDDFENLIFNGSQLGHNILGDAASLNTFDSNKAKRFVAQNYKFDNIVFFSLGQTNFKKIVRLAEKYLSHLHTSEHTSNRVIPINAPIVKQIVEKDTTQAHVLIGSRSYNLHDKKRKTLSLLNNILGGPGMNSRLNISLREKRGYVYNVESSVTSYTDTGFMSIYFGSDKQNVDKCLKLVYSELKKLRDSKLSTSQLVAAKRQLIGQIGISTDNHENLSLVLGKSFMHYNHFDSLAETGRKIESISAADLQEVANEILDEDRLFYLIYK